MNIPRSAENRSTISNHAGEISTRPASIAGPTRPAVGGDLLTLGRLEEAAAAQTIYLGTDVTSRFLRMDGRNVLHPMGYDAFGLPAEQFAVQTGQHPRVTTEANIAAIRAQLRRLGVDHDPRRTFATIDPGAAGSVTPFATAV